MPKRLQVILDDADYREVQKAARARRVSLAQWVRDALLAARRREPGPDVGRKIAAIRTAVTFDFPTGDIESMLTEIELGYGASRQR